MSDLKGFPPKVFIIGAQKAGTTQLSALLAQHEDICLSEPKEPDFFTRHYDKGFDWYKGLFNEPNKCLVDASTSYTSRPLPNVFEQDTESSTDPLIGVPQRIHNASPDAKLIYILREPAKRTYSGYWHQVSAGYEKQPLVSAIESDTSYKRISKYADQLSYYLEYFDKKNVLVLEFEQLIKAPEVTTQQCLTFLGLPSSSNIATGIHKNKSFQLPAWLQFINANIVKIKPILKAVKKVLPESVIDLGKRKLAKPVPKITSDEYDWLSKFFDDEIAKAKVLTSQQEKEARK